jgi:hypothetical protein
MSTATASSFLNAGARARDQIAARLARDPAAHVALDEGDRVASLLDVQRRTGAQEQVKVLIDRLPGAGMFELFMRKRAIGNDSGLVLILMVKRPSHGAGRILPTASKLESRN